MFINRRRLENGSARLGAGFTLIEVLVVISIITLLTSLLILYSRTSERQLGLFREQSRLVGSILRAKSLAIQTLRAATPSCGYGVHLDSVNNRYLIFSDPKAGGSCAASDKQYGGPTEAVETVDLANSGVILSPLTEVVDIFFQPPEPKTFLTPQPLTPEAAITLTTIDGASSVTIKVSKSGRVSTN